jgi:hypothetical protein
MSAKIYLVLDSTTENGKFYQNLEDAEKSLPFGETSDDIHVVEFNIPFDVEYNLSNFEGFLLDHAKSYKIAKLS